jgi:hypothetical protein
MTCGWCSYTIKDVSLLLSQIRRLCAIVDWRDARLGDEYTPSLHCRVRAVHNFHNRLVVLGGNKPPVFATKFSPR